MNLLIVAVKVVGGLDDCRSLAYGSRPANLAPADVVCIILSRRLNADIQALDYVDVL